MCPIRFDIEYHVFYAKFNFSDINIEKAKRNWIRIVEQNEIILTRMLQVTVNDGFYDISSAKGHLAL